MNTLHLPDIDCDNILYCLRYVRQELIESYPMLSKASDKKDSNSIITYFGVLISDIENQIASDKTENVC